MGKVSVKAKPKKGDKPAKKEKAFAKVGVIQTIIDSLKSASSKKPVSKEDIVKILVDKFPDREERAMKSTVSSQIPSGLRTEKGFEVEKNDKGYWLAKDAVAKKGRKASKPKVEEEEHTDTDSNGQSEHHE